MMVYAAQRYEGWRAACLMGLGKQFDSSKGGFHGSTSELWPGMLSELQSQGLAEGKNEKQLQKECMGFARLKIDEATQGGAQVRDESNDAVQGRSLPMQTSQL